MDDEYEFPDVISLYVSDINHFQSLSDSEEIWYGLAMDANKKMERLKEGKNATTNEDLEFLFISIFHKVKITSESLDNLRNLNRNLLKLSDIGVLISEITEFNANLYPVRESIIDKFLNILPEKATDPFFDLITYFLLLPKKVLEFYYKVIITTGKLPPISKLLDNYNPVENFTVMNSIRKRAKFARDMLILCNLKYIKFYAYRYQNLGLDYADVIQEGNIGLITAVDKFDVRQKSKFKTYSLWWIKQRILRAIDNDSRTIRIPVQAGEIVRQLTRHYISYINRYNSEPSFSALSEMSGIEYEKIKTLLPYCRPFLSFEEAVDCEDNLSQDLYPDDAINSSLCRNCSNQFKDYFSLAKSNQTISTIRIPLCMDPSLLRVSTDNPVKINKLLDVLDEVTIEPLDLASLSILKDVARDELNNMDLKERRILELRFGFYDGENWTLQEVGDIFGITRERVRQIESNLLTKLSKKRRLKREINIP